jgi:hypothetical protein
MDHRDMNRHYYAPYKIVGDTIHLFEDGYEDDPETNIKLPVQFQVCGTCQGRGRHVNPSIDSNGLPDDMVNDPEFMEGYMSGSYDVTCSECQGRNVTPTSKDERFIRAVDNAHQMASESYHEQEAERRAGC